MDRQEALLDHSRNLVRRHGVAPLTATLTAAAVLVSQAVAGLVMLLWQTPDWKLGLFLATLMPLLATPPTAWMLLGLVRRVAVAEDKLERMSRIDTLTGVSNRRHFGELAESALKMSQRYGHPLALMIMDIDNFKRINEEHGHGMGDKVLFGFARMCADALRDSDLFGRFAGEEFVAALPHAETESAREVADRLRRRIEKSPLSFDGVSVPITVSIGVAVAEPERDRDKSLQDLYNLAAGALSRAKANGRNRVELADVAPAGNAAEKKGKAKAKKPSPPSSPPIDSETN